ncbi:MAG: hypothetical protein ACI853_001717 [Paracoccaceae bacterium]|jgi:hypothetical protein
MLASVNNRVEMKVHDGGENILAYTFGSLAEAASMRAYLKDFFPQATFVIQPLRH